MYQVLTLAAGILAGILLAIVACKRRDDADFIGYIERLQAWAQQLSEVAGPDQKLSKTESAIVLKFLQSRILDLKSGSVPGPSKNDLAMLTLTVSLLWSCFFSVVFCLIDSLGQAGPWAPLGVAIGAAALGAVAGWFYANSAWAATSASDGTGHPTK